ncbi:hypothetical protein MRX96_026251 [Rhipicephalus microplus]
MASHASLMDLIGNTGRPLEKLAPKTVEESVPPSTARIALGTLLVIAVMLTMALTLASLDLPFLPRDGRQGSSRSGYANAHRHRERVICAAMENNDIIDEVLDWMPAVNTKRMTSTLVSNVYAH